MAYLHDDGELLVLDSAFDGRTVNVGLFDDSTDALNEDSTYADITTEPTGSAYSAQTVDDTEHTVSMNANDDAELDLGDVEFDVSDSSEDVDYLYVRDDTSGDLIFTAALDQTYDLDSVDTLSLTNVGMTLS